MTKEEELMDKINPEKISKPILFIMAIGCIISIIGLIPILLFNNFIILQVGLILIGFGTFLLIIITIIVAILLVADMRHYIFEKEN